MKIPSANYLNIAFGFDETKQRLHRKQLLRQYVPEEGGQDALDNEEGPGEEVVAETRPARV